MEPLRGEIGGQLFYRDEHLFVDPRHRLVVLDHQALTLTRKEYRLLVLLVQHCGQVVPRAILLMGIWGYGPDIRTRTLDAHVRQLRKKLGTHGGRYIETVVGVGYSFRPFHGSAIQEYALVQADPRGSYGRGEEI